MPAKSVKIGDKTYHLPFVDLIPYSDEQFAALGQKIAEAGRVKEPVVCWKERRKKNEETVIDGGHRVLHAAELKLDKVPVRYESYASEEEAEADCGDLNLWRRHLTPQQLEQQRRAFIERVAARRAAGESLRGIAQAENVSHTAVSRALRRAGGTGGNSGPPGGKVTGRDGRKQSATHAPKNPLLCQKKADAAAKKAAKGKKPPKATEAPRPARTDAAGEPIPDRVQKHFDGIMDIKLWCENLAELAAQLPALRKAPGGRGISDAVEVDLLEAVVGRVLAELPAYVCQVCHGLEKKCSLCDGQGWVTKATYKAV